jgi:hypothetical protein
MTITIPDTFVWAVFFGVCIMMLLLIIWWGVEAFLNSRHASRANTKEQNIAFRKDWDQRYEQGLKSRYTRSLLEGDDQLYDQELDPPTT